MNTVLKAHAQLFKLLFNEYKESVGKAGGKEFTINSALKLLKAAKIEFTRKQPQISHEEFVRRLFGNSKQTVENEHEFLFYDHLKEVEFLEFMARVADEIYHTSNAHKIKGLGKESMFLRRMAVEPLESKIYELFQAKFADWLKMLAD